MNTALAAAAAFLFAAAPCAAAEKPTGPASVIVVVADGLGQHVLLHALDSYRRTGAPKLQHIQTFLQRAQGASVTSYSYGGEITDSAAAATAMACGVKTKNGVVGLTPKGRRPVCVPDLARKAGKAIGLITDSYSWDATPAGFSVYADNRKEEDVIRRRLAELKPEILMGSDLGPVDLLSAARRAVKTLSRDPDGFFLLFETEETDTAGHKNDLKALYKGLEILDPALAILADYQAKHPNTTLFFLSDHDCGGMNQDETWTTHGHSHAPAFLYAVGPGSKKLTALIDNTRIFSLLAPQVGPSD